VRRILSLLVVLFGVVAAWSIGRRGAELQPAAPPAAGGGEARSAGVLRMDSVLRLREWTLQRIAESSTYLPAMLSQSDSVLKRWSDRTSIPLLVYLPPGGAPDYRPELGQAVRSAFDRWERVAGIPVLFVFTRDSSRADVVVRWISEFSIERTGQADVRWNGAGWLLSGTLTLATHNPGGIALPPQAIYTVALHEIGHLLGLGHSDNPADVMYPTTDVRVDITVRDRQTARLLYQLPPGTVRHP
jgi:hypothetical protein